MNTMRHVMAAMVGGAFAVLGTALPGQQQGDQDPVLPKDPAQVFSIADLTSHWIQDGDHWVAGDYYRAGFVGGTMEFTPALGSAAPRDMVWRYSFQRIERGGVSLASTQAEAPPEVRFDQDTIRIPRGEGIEEVHHVRGSGLEITYELASRPHGKGDLVVVSDVATELIAPHGRANAAGLEFSLPGIGGVRLSRVVGVDASGRRVAGSMSWDGQQLSFSLPGTFLDDAVYPVVLDPTVSPTRPVANGEPESKLDVAYSSRSTVREYLVTWHRVFSSSNSVVRAARFDATTYASITSNYFQVSLAGPQFFSQNPSVGYSRALGMHLVAYEISVGIFGARAIRVTAIGAGGEALVASLPLTFPEFTPDQSSPDVCGDARTTGSLDNWLVVWSDSGNGIMASRVFISGTGLAQSDQQLTNEPTDRQPSICKARHSTLPTAVVWKTQSGQIEGRLLSASGFPLGAEVALSPSGAGECSNPQIDGEDGAFLAVWQEEESPGVGVHDIKCQFIRYAGTGVDMDASAPEFSPPGAADPMEDEQSPAVGLLTKRFAVAYQDAVSTLNGPWHVLVSYVKRDGCVACIPRDSLFPAMGRLIDPAVGSQYAGGGTDDVAAVTFSVATLAPPFAGGGLVRGIGTTRTSQVVSNRGGGCGNAGTVAVLNPPAGILGNLDNEIQLNATSPSASFAFLWGAVANQPRFQCGLCRALDPAVLQLNIGTQVIGGRADVPVPIPCQPGLAGVSVEFQFVVFTTGTTPCGLVPGASLSDIFEITLTQ